MCKEFTSDLEGVISLISKDDLEKPLIELDNREENEELWDYLEEIGTIRVEFKISQEPRLASFTTMAGIQDLIYKRNGETWVIKIYFIKAFLSKS